jgi:hypothetical protein
MLWLGGALNSKNIVIDTFGSQSDLAKTLVNQFGLGNSDYIFSNDILSDSPASFGFYSFNSGFGYYSDQSKIIFDLGNNYSIIAEGEQSEKSLNSAKAYLQVLSEDFSLR